MCVVKQALEKAGMLENTYNIQKIEAGMTNYMYSFINNGKKYLVRIPGEGTEFLVNRQQEAEVYKLLKGRGITDKVLYINADDGVKITEYLDDAHVCNIDNADEVGACIRHLRQFHEMKLHIGHEFDVYRKIEEYEKQCGTTLNDFGDYENTRTKIMDLRKITEHRSKDYCLCHIDPVADNFLLKHNSVYLIDWEYAAMCDPHIDIAMFCIYSELNKENTDFVIDNYFLITCPDMVRRKIYAYMAAGAFLWVLWSDIKKASGENYEDYQRRQYEIAEEFYRYATE
ncbi:MAG: phosphotransferase [Lachnospiraceae bacterium]